MQGPGRATVRDLAQAAGVSLATVDRVLNGRPGVRPATIEKVEAAIARLGFRRDLTASMLARARDIGLAVILPEGSNQFMNRLAEAAQAVGRQVRGERLRLDLLRIRAIDPGALIGALDGLSPDSHECAAIVAIDTPEVHAAVARAGKRGIRIITLVSDLPHSARHGFVGIDNVAAGRTAASLMGRFCRMGKVGLVAGSLDLRDHAERIAGFRAVTGAQYPRLEIVGPVEGQDAFTATYEQTLALLRAHPDLMGLYNVGAGNAGMLTALAEMGMNRSVAVIAHELTGPTRAGLASGAVDVVIDQGPEAEIRAVCEMAWRLVLGADAAPPERPLEIRIFLRDNLP